MTTHPEPTDGANGLSHEEVWDDSTLIDAWDEALEEYKKYHSILATGEDPEGLLKAAAEELGDMEVDVVAEIGEGVGADVDASTDVQDAMDDDYSPPGDAEVKVEMEEAEAITAPERDADIPIIEDVRDTQPSQSQSQPQPAPPFPPAAVGGNDENMRNLMMAWYWAGYYTGLQDGQRGTTRPSQTQPGA